jgi:hypothetical protein
MTEIQTKKDDQYITIVSGLPRSGTSMMMQMLAAGGLAPLADNLRQPDEDNPQGYYEFERVKQVATDVSWLDEAEGKVVKMVYRLLYDLPADRTYRVVFMTRELSEVIASQEVMLERHGLAGEKTADGMLVEIYRCQLSDVFEWLSAQPNFSALFVDYHDVLRDPGSVIEALDSFLDGRLDTQAMLQVPDWSLYRQRREAIQTAPAAAGA